MSCILAFSEGVLPDWVTWVLIAFCLSQSAIFSGLNLAYFSVGRLRLEALVHQGEPGAEKILRLRKDSNFLLCTILWGNVSVNVLLALLSESVLAGLGGFIFSTVGITFFGEIMPQAYFSRHALRVGAMLSPLIRFYQILLAPVAKPAALLLDGWIGMEGIAYFREQDLRALLEKHVEDESTEIGAAEGIGALNFLKLDDLKISEEGRELDPRSVFAFSTKLDVPNVPGPGDEGGQSFIQKLAEVTDRKWVVLTDLKGVPLLVLDADHYVRSLSANPEVINVYDFCHRPVIVEDAETTLDGVLDRLVVESDHHEDRVVDEDVVLYWGEENRRIITGPDILGSLLHGIVRVRQE